jgi:acetyl-CoA carboxylase carboxyl transferase subunit alpha
MLFPQLQVPTIAIVTGEGGSGGALALSVADRLLMLSNSVFSVASAEACSSIIWKDAGRAEEMASYLRVTAQDLKELGIVDEIIPEPVGGAHQDFTALADSLKKSLELNLKELQALNREQLLKQRYRKIRGIGRFLE